ncbi:MAG: aldo/keto reductase [Planctomycetota bacterium]|nr:aldo/keto reductase [Planctomycetota bacterium]
MRYRRLGRTGLEVSELSYGAARGASEDPAGFVRVVHAAIAEGVNLIDTAGGYDGGESEKRLGEALTGHDDVIVETKYCPYESYAPDATFNGTPRALRASAQESLRRLRRDRIDILLGHGMRSIATMDRFMTEGCYEEMLRLKQEGLVRFVGVSELSEADGEHEVLRHILPGGGFDVVMLTINLLLQTAVGSVLPLCHEHDVGTVVMMPLNQASRESGLVSVPAALECVRRHVAARNLPAGPPYASEDLWDFLRPYSIPEAGVRYVLAHEVGTCCVGFRGEERLRENLQAIDPPYLDEARLERARELFGRIARQVR